VVWDEDEAKDKDARFVYPIRRYEVLRATFTAMKHPARWLIAFALCACAMAWWSNRTPREPSYMGKPLSQWMRKNSGASVGEFAEAAEQLRHAGPLAVNWLAYSAEHGYSDYSHDGPFLNLVGNIRSQLRSSKMPSRYDERLLSVAILGCMGPHAKPAIPALARILKSDSYIHVLSAAETLNLIGPDSWPVVEEQVVHGSNLARCELLQTMWHRLEPKSGLAPRNEADFERDITKVVNFLSDALRDPEPNIRRNAASSFSRTLSTVKVPGPLLDQAAVALWRLQEESNKEVRGAREKVRSYYSDTKAEAIPRLTALLAETDQAKRNFAQSILDNLKRSSPNADAR
jgi:hypothetical protein